MGAAAHVKQFNNHGLPQSTNNPNAFLINRLWVKFDSEQREHNPDAQTYSTQITFILFISLTARLSYYKLYYFLESDTFLFRT